MNTKQFLKLIVIIAGSYLVMHLLIYVSGDSLFVVVEKAMSASFILAAVLVALSVGMFTYVDNIAKELTDLRNDVDRSLYKIAQGKLTELKKEILFNAVLIIVLYLLVVGIDAVGSYIVSAGMAKNSWLTKTICLSLRVSCVVAAAFAAISQLLGFIVAAEYREVIANNRK